MKSIENVVDSVRAAARTIFILGVVLVILGVLSIMMPWAAGLAAQTLVGLLFIAAGVAWITFAFHAHDWGSGIWESLVGMFAIVSGVIMVSHPLVGLAALTLVVASYFIATGILKIVFAFRIRMLKGWVWVLVNGIVSVLLGVLISYQWPWSGLYAIGTLLGIDLVFGGFSLIQMGSAAQRVLSR
jgi:uncharacterized membrane protein HdeD (DUF308 family)